MQKNLEALILHGSWFLTFWNRHTCVQFCDIYFLNYYFYWPFIHFFYSVSGIGKYWHWNYAIPDTFVIKLFSAAIQWTWTQTRRLLEGHWLKIKLIWIFIFKSGIVVDFDQKKKHLKKAPFQGKKRTFLAKKAPISQTKSTFGAGKKPLVNIILLTVNGAVWLWM